MFATIRNRMILIAVLVIGSIIALIPRTVTVRERSATGAMQDVQDHGVVSGGSRPDVATISMRVVAPR